MQKILPACRTKINLQPLQPDGGGDVGVMMAKRDLM